MAYRKRKLENENANKRLQLVICKGEDVLALTCLQIGPVSICYPRIKGLPELQIKAETMCQEDFDYMNRYLEKLLHSEKRGIAKYHATPIAMVGLEYGKLLNSNEEDISILELQEILKKEHLLEKQVSEAFEGTKMEKRNVFLPTQYGTDIGLIKGYGVNERGKVYCRSFCSGEALEEIGNLLVWKQKNKHTPNKRRIPFAERIERLNQNFPGDSTCGIRVIKNFAKLSIEEYLKQLPEDFEELKSILKEHGKLKENMTYQAVAVATHQLLQSEEQEKAGKRLMEILANPVVKKVEEREAAKQNAKKKNTI